MTKPAVGDKVRIRGSQHVGIVDEVFPSGNVHMFPVKPTGATGSRYPYTVPGDILEIVDDDKTTVNQIAVLVPGHTTPAINDRVRIRGTEHTGIVKQINGNGSVAFESDTDRITDAIKYSYLVPGSVVEVIDSVGNRRTTDGWKVSEVKEALKRLRKIIDAHRAVNPSPLLANELRDARARLRNRLKEIGVDTW